MVCVEDDEGIMGVPAIQGRSMIRKRCIAIEKENHDLFAPCAVSIYGRAPAQGLTFPSLLPYTRTCYLGSCNAVALRRPE